ncbi:MAG: dockerin type I repeat-containing protein, partial [Chthoniobacterales bacterium]
DQCLAIGGYGSQPLFERWNGTAWSYGTTPYLSGPGPMGFQPQLIDIACNSASDCWAVGLMYSNLFAGTLIERWNGSSWQVVPSPSPGTAQGEPSILQGVTCTSVTDCWAVGGYYLNSVSQPLIERWNGISWTIVPLPNAPQAGAFFQDITCPSASDCWAVGYVSATGITQTLIERWDGTAWSVYPSPSPGTYAQINDVTCTSAYQCWAVGYQNNANNTQTLILRWDGHSWQLTPSPNSPDGGGILNGVTCVSPTQCWAVGTKDLIEQWDGSSWSLAPFFNTRNLNRSYESVACASDSHCWAIGSGVIAEYSTINPPLRSVSSRMTHGSSGTFDVGLMPTAGASNAVECRASAELGRYQMVFTFPTFSPIVASTSVTGGGTVMSSGPGLNANEYVVDLTGVPDRTRVNVSLDNVVDAQNNTGSVSAMLAVLIGDTNGDGVVNSLDLDQAKTSTGERAGPTNFRTDVSANGAINAGDIARIKANSGAQLPP